MEDSEIYKFVKRIKLSLPEINKIFECDAWYIKDGERINYTKHSYMYCVHYSEVYVSVALICFWCYFCFCRGISGGYLAREVAIGVTGDDGS